MAPLAVGNFSDSDEAGITGLFMAALLSKLDRRNIDPALLAPALQRAFGELYALGAFEQRELVRRVFADVTDEHLPLFLEAVVVGRVLRQLLPIAIEVVQALLVRIPDWPRRHLPRLDHAVGQSGDRRAMRAVDLESDEVVAVDPRHPAHVDVCDHAALEAERRVSRIVGGRLVFLVLLVPALGNVSVADADHAFDLTKEIVEHVAPVADHVENDAPAVFRAVIPRWPLRFLPVALEHPVTELAAHRQHAAEESGLAQESELLQTRQEQLVLDHAVLEALAVAKLHDRNRFFEIGRGRLFAIDMLAGVERSRQQARAGLRGRGVKEHGVFLVGKRRIEIGGPALDAEALRQRLDLVRVAADQNRIRHHVIAVGEFHAALLPDRDDRTDQMLVETHAAGNTVHDDAEALRRHIVCSCNILAFACWKGCMAGHSGCVAEAKPGAVSDPVRRSPSWIASRTLSPARA